MTLEGRRVVVTRAEHQAESLVRRIEQAGGIALRYPCIAIGPPADTRPLDDALLTLTQFDWLLLTSENTVHALYDRVQQLPQSVNWDRVKIATVGPKTGEAAAEILGKSPAFVPEDYTGEALANSLPLSEGDRILLPISALATDDLAQALTQRGASCTVVDAYSNTIGSGGDDVPASIRLAQVDAITFTSASTVHNFIQRIAPETAFDIAAVCIGPSTCDAALQVGFHKALYPEQYTLDGLVDNLCELFSEVEYGNPE